jgi:stage IV sporulation protein B
MTFFNPENNSFSGLGHGICDVDTGSLMPLLKGTVVDVELTDIIKGKEGKPGELKGNFGSHKKGVLLGNTQMGVYGQLDEALDSLKREALPIALQNEVKEGKATILSNVDGEGVKEYEIEISKIYRNPENTKNFVINVTDKNLIEKTGGIVQGMSGSPIIQNGKLVGAVTHVLINNPTKGYGIFIENMLAETEKISD